MELSDLPPRYREQAQRQIVEQTREKQADRLRDAVKSASAAGLDFDSRGEFEYFAGVIAPKAARGEIVSWEAHPAFVLFPQGEYCGIKLRSVRYTADFRLNYADGTVEIVEVKSKFVRRMQRDYPVRRRVFLETVARPAGWKFTEIITSDSEEDVKQWRACRKKRPK